MCVCVCVCVCVIVYKYVYVYVCMYRIAGFLREDFNITSSTFRNIKIRIVFVKRGDL